MRLMHAEGDNGQETNGKELRFHMFKSNKARKSVFQGCVLLQEMGVMVREGPCFPASSFWMSS